MNLLTSSLSLLLAGKTGILRFDEQGDRETDYSVKHYQNGRWEEVVVIDSDNNQSSRLRYPLIWDGKEELPLDTPSCGYDGKNCAGWETFNLK